MTHPRLLPFLLFTVLLAVRASGEVPLREGVTYLDLSAGPDSLTPAELFSTSDLPAGSDWSSSARLIEAAPASGAPRAVWRARGGWQGNLRQLRPGGYWLVLPPGSPAATLDPAPGIDLRAGRLPASWQPATGWTVRPGDDGLTVTHGPLPQSSARYSVSYTLKTRWTAKGGVAIQDPPPSPSPGWVRVKLDSLGVAAPGVEDVLAPLPGQAGTITVPWIPDFSTPPWEGETGDSSNSR